MISDYAFGRIVVDGVRYTADIIIYPDGRVQSSWRRGQGHRLCFDDIAGLAESNPQLIIAGTGAFGLMQPESGLEGMLAEKGISFEAVESKKAVERYNRLCTEMNVGACFHLTC